MELKKIIIVNYYGKLPEYASYFFESCKKNAAYQFIIFNDIHPDEEDQNLRFIKSTLQDFNKKASQSLGILINLDRGFKVCDLRPAYGVIYSDLIHGFDFWGFCDLDIILGNLNHFLSDDFLENTDVYSSKPLWNSGSFSLFRNAPEVNTAFQITEDWKFIFTTNKYYGFDECLQRWDGKPISMTKRKEELLSIYDIIHSNDQIRSCYADTVIEWPKDIKRLKWSNGSWFDLRDNKEFMYFHLLLMKNSWRFYQPRLDFSEDIYVTGLGLSVGDHRLFTIDSLVWRLRRAMYCFSGVVRNQKKKFLSK